jgi:monothiol glutaredoxin
MVEAGNPFRILDADSAGQEQAAGGGRQEDDQIALERVTSLVSSSGVFMFIKGSPQAPQCGFSANTVAIMNSLGVRYSTFDVLADDEVRAAAKEFARWPTYPQVYVRGQFVGGNDILTEMHASGELQQLVSEFRS